MSPSATERGGQRQGEEDWEREGEGEGGRGEGRERGREGEGKGETLMRETGPTPYHHLEGSFSSCLSNSRVQ